MKRFKHITASILILLLSGCATKQAIPLSDSIKPEPSYRSDLQQSPSELVVKYGILEKDSLEDARAKYLEKVAEYNRNKSVDNIINTGSMILCGLTLKFDCLTQAASYAMTETPLAGKVYLIFSISDEEKALPKDEIIVRFFTEQAVQMKHYYASNKLEQEPLKPLLGPNSKPYEITSFSFSVSDRNGENCGKEYDCDVFINIDDEGEHQIKGNYFIAEIDKDGSRYWSDIFFKAAAREVAIFGGKRGILFSNALPDLERHSIFE